MVKDFMSAGELTLPKMVYDEFSIICMGLTCKGTEKRYLCKLFEQILHFVQNDRKGVQDDREGNDTDGIIN